MDSSTIRKFFLSAVFIAISLGLVPRAFAQNLMVVDLKTDWQPGLEFTAARATLDPGYAQDHPIYSTDDTVLGTRIAEFDNLPNGTYNISVQLLRPDETVLDTRHIVATISSTFAVTAIFSRSGDPQPVCGADLGAVIAERDQCVGTDLPSCQSDRDTCVNERDACIGERETCTDQRLLCETSLDTCSGMLGVCNDELASLQSDEDGDGIIAVLDLCPDTPSGGEGDVMGCSRAQFCSTVVVASSSDGRICRRADWRNDEPGSVNPGDCDVGSDGMCGAAE